VGIYVNIGMNSSFYFTAVMGVYSITFGPKAVQIQQRINRRWNNYWDLVNRSKKAKRDGDLTYGQQLRNLSLGHFVAAKKLEQRRWVFGLLSLTAIFGVYTVLRLVGVITD